MCARCVRLAVLQRTQSPPTTSAKQRATTSPTDRKRSPDDSPLRDGNRDRLYGLVSEREDEGERESRRRRKRRPGLSSLCVRARSEECLERLPLPMLEPSIISLETPTL